MGSEDQDQIPGPSRVAASELSSGNYLQAYLSLPELSFKCLADEKRRTILKLLLEIETGTVSELAKNFSVTDSVVGRHLLMLSHAKILKRSKEGQTAIYSVRDEIRPLVVNLVRLPDRFFKLMEDETRRKLLTALLDSGDRRTASELAQKQKTTLANIGRHLTMLANAGFLDKQKEGKQAFYQVEETWTPTFNPNG